MAHLLLVEDDAGIAEPLVRALEREGHVVEHVMDGRSGAERGTSGEHDLVVLDLGLPGLDGIEVCRRIKASSSVPVLMLTARADEVDTVLGLDTGADDYVTKPFRLAELTARIRARLRTAPEAAVPGRLRIDVPGRQVFLGDEEVDLTQKEFDLLAYLAAHPGQAMRRQQIMEEVWDRNWFGSTKTLDVHLSSLRRKLGDDAESPEIISTVRGVGFRFEAP